MSGMDRRQFLAGAGAAALVTGTGCVSAPMVSGAAGVPDLSALDMDGILHSLDSTLGLIRSSASFPTVVTPEAQQKVTDDERMAGTDDLMRDAFRSLFLVSAFREMGEPAQAHPGVQARVLAGIGELDSSVIGIHRTLQSLTPTERADAARALRDDPKLRERVLRAIDAEAARVEAPPAQRAHLRRVTEHVGFRLRQSPGLFYDELDRKMEKVASRELSVDDSERWFAAMMGRQAFEDKRARMIALARAWQSVPGIAQSGPLPSSAPAPATTGSLLLAPAGTAGLPPAAPATAHVPPVVPTVLLPVDPGSILVPPEVLAHLPPPRYPLPRDRRGKWTLRAGGMLCGVGLLHGGIGVALAFTGNFIGAFEITHGALQLIGGIVTLLVGAAQLGGSRDEETTAATK